jgi:thymidylate synthase (FAD)
MEHEMAMVKPYAKMLDIYDEAGGVALLQKIEWCGRISHRSEEARTATSWKRFIEAVVIGKGDWSITEHVSITVDAVVDRGITHEWVRHRMGAYTQESTRFVNYEKKMPPSFIQPDFGDDVEAKKMWTAAIEACEITYKGLMKKGVAPQIARSVFPNALSSRIVVTYNLRNWRHFFLMRTTREAHPQMREVTIPLLKEFQKRVPLLYDDIVPDAPQIENLKKAR